MSKTDEVQQKVVEWMDSIEEGVKEYSPEVVDAGLTVVQLIGLQELVLATIGLLIVAAIILSGYKTYVSYHEYSKEDSPGNHGTLFKMWGLRVFDSDGDPQAGSVAIIIAVFTIIGISIPSLVSLLNIWNWVAVFYPKLWIAHKAVEGVLGS